MDDMLKKLWRKRPWRVPRSERKEPRIPDSARTKKWRWNPEERRKRRKVAKESRRKNRPPRKRRSPSSRRKR